MPRLETVSIRKKTHHDVILPLATISEHLVVGHGNRHCAGRRDVAGTASFNHCRRHEPQHRGCPVAAGTALLCLLANWRGALRPAGTGGGFHRSQFAGGAAAKSHCAPPPPRAVPQSPPPYVLHSRSCPSAL